jgi:hypothetical protein
MGLAKQNQGAIDFVDNAVGIVISTNVETVMGLIYRGCSRLRRLMLIESNYTIAHGQSTHGAATHGTQHHEVVALGSVEEEVGGVFSI